MKEIKLSDLTLSNHSSINELMTVEVTGEFILGIMGAGVAAFGATIPYFLAKRNELQINMKKSKLERYDDLLSNLTAFLENPNPKNAFKLVLAYNRSTSYATTAVLQACHNFLKSMNIDWRIRHASSDGGQPKTLEASLEENIHKANQIFKAIRKDINPKEPDFNFEVYVGKKI